MKTNLKRALALLLALVMVCCVLTGCGQKATGALDPVADPAAEEPIAQISETVAEGRTLLDNADFEGATAAYSEALKTGNLSLEERAEAYAFLISYYIAIGESSKAKAYLADAANDGVLVNTMLDYIFITAEKVEQNDMEAQSVYNTFMNEAMKQSDYESAVKLADAIMEKNPDDSAALVAAYIAYKESGNEAKAAGILSQAEGAGFTEDTFGTATVRYIEEQGLTVVTIKTEAAKKETGYDNAGVKRTENNTLYLEGGTVAGTINKTYNEEGKQDSQEGQDANGQRSDKFDENGKRKSIDLTVTEYDRTYTHSLLGYTQKITALTTNLIVNFEDDGTKTAIMITPQYDMRTEMKLDKDGNLISAMVYSGGEEYDISEDAAYQFQYVFNSEGDLTSIIMPDLDEQGNIVGYSQNYYTYKYHPVTGDMDKIVYTDLAGNRYREDTFSIDSKTGKVTKEVNTYFATTEDSGKEYVAEEVVLTIGNDGKAVSSLITDYEVLDEGKAPVVIYSEQMTFENGMTSKLETKTFAPSSENPGTVILSEESSFAYDGNGHPVAGSKKDYIEKDGKTYTEGIARVKVENDVRSEMYTEKYEVVNGESQLRKSEYVVFDPTGESAESKWTALSRADGTMELTEVGEGYKQVTYYKAGGVPTVTDIYDPESNTVTGALYFMHDSNGNYQGALLLDASYYNILAQYSADQICEPAVPCPPEDFMEIMPFSLEEPDEDVALCMMEEPVEEVIEEVTEEPVEEVAEEVTEEPAEEPAEEVAEEPAEEVAEEPAEEVAEEVTEEPAEEPVPVVAAPAPAVEEPAPAEEEPAPAVEPVPAEAA